MAKRKLSAEQRAALRKELKKAVSSNKNIPDVLRAVARKYGISEITARWYLKSLDGQKAARRRPGRPKGSGNGNADLLKIVTTRSEKAKEAKRLVPRWQALVTKERNLRRKSRSLERRLSAVQRKVTTVRAKLDELVRT